MEWANQIDDNLNKADIILLLISPDFVASDYCSNIELSQAIRRHEAGEAIVVPVILEPCDWTWLPFSKFQAFPKDAKAITTWINQNEAFLDVAAGIRKVAQELFAKRQQQAEQKQLIRAQYLQKVEEVLSDGEISIVERDTLDELQETLGLTPEEAKEIEAHAYEPFSKYKESLNKYQQTLNRLIERGYYPFSEEIEKDLKNRQRDLGIKPEDAARISKPILAQAELDEQVKKQKLAEAESTQELELQRQQQQQEYAAKLERYRQEFSKAVEAEYPLHPAALENLKTFQHQLELKDEDVEAIVSPILAVKQAEYDRQQAEQAAQRDRPSFSPKPTQTVTPKPTETISSQTFEFPTAKLTIVQKQGWLGSKNTVEISHGKGRAEYFAENLGSGVTLEMVKIPAGEFLMGAATGEASSGDDERPQHRVNVPEFWMGKFAVTQEQWNRVAGLSKVKLDLNSDPSSFKGAKRPVEQVSWDEAVEFCARLNGFVEARLSRKTGKLYRLPTEAEWEYACRAGTTTPFHFGETITPDLVNFDGNSTYGNTSKGEYRGQTTGVGSFPANAFGLFDMHGNVWEWCADQWYGSYANKPEQLKQNGAIAWTEETTGVAPKSDETEYRLLRGGSWYDYPGNCRSANRGRLARDYRSSIIGFRVVCSVSRTS
jgi:formylglycine-generating enzyme required for sulfatase activity